jgi:hypothetical protein
LPAELFGLAQDFVERPGGGDGVVARSLAHPHAFAVGPDAEAALLAPDRHRAGRAAQGDDHVQGRRPGRDGGVAADRAEDQDLGASEVRRQGDLVRRDAGDDRLPRRGPGEREREEERTQHHRRGATT